MGDSLLLKSENMAWWTRTDIKYGKEHKNKSKKYKQYFHGTHLFVPDGRNCAKTVGTVSPRKSARWPYVWNPD
eukprot:12037053-Heterocapsa_arctica.AAC.1